MPVLLQIKTNPDMGRFARILDRSFKNATEKQMWEWAKLLEGKIREEAPKRTGKLAAGIHARKRRALRYTIEERVKYGVFLREGVDPSRRNPILPVNKRALWWEGADHPVRAVYNHPGIKKNDYVQRGLDALNVEVISQGAKDLRTLILQEMLWQGVPTR